MKSGAKRLVVEGSVSNNGRSLSCLVCLVVGVGSLVLGLVDLVLDLWPRSGFFGLEFPWLCLPPGVAIERRKCYGNRLIARLKKAIFFPSVKVHDFECSLDGILLSYFFDPYSPWLQVEANKTRKLF
jgi:hypothetical protein